MTMYQPCAGGFQEWVENMTDQSHVAFAHHGVAGNRCGKYFCVHLLFSKNSGFSLGCHQYVFAIHRSQEKMAIFRFPRVLI